MFYPNMPMRVLCSVWMLGDHVLWFSRFFQGKEQQVLVSGRWRGMGFSLGSSIAAQLVYPERQVFCLVGDGGSPCSWATSYPP